MTTEDETKDKSFAEAWKQPGTTVLPIMIVESKDIALDAFKNMPRETYEAYIAKKSAVATATQIFEELDILFGEGFYSAPMDERCYKLYKHEYDALKKKYGVLK